MRSLAPLAAALLLVSGCMLVFDAGGSGGDVDDGGSDCQITELPSVSLRNPDQLWCETFTASPCDLGCCEQALSTPPPSWGACGSSCEGLAEAACAGALDCRVVKDAACALSGTCATDFLGCFPTPRFPDPQLDCFTARDGESCSQSAACIAYHRGTLTAAGARTFAMCAPEGKAPGTCFAEVVCNLPAPACPADHRPGVAEGCYTGACIPADVCEPAPLQ